MRQFRLTLVFFLALYIAAFDSIAQCMMEPLSLNEIVDHSDEAFEGMVTSKSCFRDENNGAIYTRYTIHVSEALGTGNEYVSILAQGGVVDGYAQMVFPSLQLAVGERGLFLCKKNQEDFLVTAVSQGFFGYERNLEKAYNTFGEKFSISELKEQIASRKGERFSIVSDAIVPTQSAFNSSRGIGITSISPTHITAGTNQVLTINGFGFGDGQYIGHIAFNNANNGGANFIEVPQGPHVLSWTDTQIKVTVPSATVYGQFVAGTGPVKIINAGGGEAVSSEVLNVKYAKSEIYYNGNIEHTDLADMNQEGGYTIHFAEDIFNNSDALRAYAVALNTWKCNTGVNLKPDTFNYSTASVSYNDGISLVKFDNSNSLFGGGTLGTTVISYSACYFDGKMHWVMTEMDMSIKSNFSWYFGNGEVPNGQFDFTSVILHELGHSQLIQHNLNENSAMYYKLSAGQSKRHLHPESDMGATNDVINESGHLDLGCSYGPMQVAGPEDCNQALTGVHNHYADEINVYPNPTTGLFFVEGLKELHLPRLQVFNAMGALVLEKYPNTERTQIDLGKLASGIYALRIFEGEELIKTNKIMVSGR